MANEEQLSILKQGVEVWNKWRQENPNVEIDLGIPVIDEKNFNKIPLSGVNLHGAQLIGINLKKANLHRIELYGADLRRAELIDADLSWSVLGNADLRGADFSRANLTAANLWGAHLNDANLVGANLHKVNISIFDDYSFWDTFDNTELTDADLRGANLTHAILIKANLTGADLTAADLSFATLRYANLNGANLGGTRLTSAEIEGTNFGKVDLREVIGLSKIEHGGPSTVGIDTIALSKGQIPSIFLRGCGLSDWEIEQVKLYNPDLSNNEFIDIQNRIFELRNQQALQISSLFISYSHADRQFIDQLENNLNKLGVRFWRDVHHATAGRLEKQIDRAMRLNPTVLLILSENSLSSDWVEHEVRAARGLEKEIERDVLCPVALDDSWKSSRWPKRVMEQIIEYNILDFSGWQDDSKFDGMFRKLIDGLELFYKG